MKNKFFSKEISITRKHTVKKPKFWIEFLKCLAVCAAISIAMTSLVLFNQKITVANEISEIYEDYARAVDEDARVLFETEKTDESYDYIYNRLEWKLNLFSVVNGCYAAIYDGDEKIMESQKGASAIFALEGEDPNAPFKDFYILENASYLDPIFSYENGKYDLKKSSTTEQAIINDPLAAFGSLVGMDVYGYLFEDVYINEETHRFLPGKVLIYAVNDSVTYGDTPTATIDCTPSDTKGYTHINSSKMHAQMIYYLDQSEADIDVWRYNNVCIGVDEKGEVGMEFDQSIRMSYRNPEKQSVWSLLPVTSRIVIFMFTVLALLFALIAALIRYFKKKNIWDAFEYRRKTTEAMAHDLKTPLATISAYAETLEEGLLQGKESAVAGTSSVEQARMIRENVDEMNRMLENILDFSRSGSGKGMLKKQDVDVGKLVEEGKERFGQLFAKKGIKINSTGAKTCIKKTDEDLLRQSIDNLISNCARYADPDSTIEIALSEESLSIKNKTSIRVENVADLKKPFVKGESSRGENGTGLGLAIVDSNLRALGYRLDLKMEDGWFCATVLF